MTDRRTAILGTLSAAIAAATGTTVEAKKKKKKKKRCSTPCLAYQVCTNGSCVPAPLPSSYVREVAGDTIDNVAVNYGAMTSRGSTLYALNAGTSQQGPRAVLVFGVNASTGALTYLRQFGSYGAGNDGMIGPVAMTFAGDYLLIADSDGHRIKVWYIDPSTGVATARAQIGSQGIQPGQFSNPMGIAYSATHGKVYVVQSHALQWFDFNTAKGTASNFAQDTWSEAPDFPGQAVLVGSKIYFTEPTPGLLSIAVASDGTVSGNPSSVVVASGAPGFGEPRGIAYLNGRFYVNNSTSPFTTQIFDNEPEGSLSYIGSMADSQGPYAVEIPRSTAFVGPWAYVSYGQNNQFIALFTQS